MAIITFRLNEHLFVRDPQHTELGQRIIQKSIDLIDQLGYEGFTFRKLADELGSTEASIYRYFENKHRPLLYLISWYWCWMEYRIDLHTTRTADAKERLKASLRVVAEKKVYDSNIEFVNEEKLHRIVVAKLNNTFLTKAVDEDNRDGLFGGFKTLCRKIAACVEEINPRYPYPNALISTLLLAAHQQLFFASHLPSLSNLQATEDRHETLYAFLESLALNSIMA